MPPICARTGKAARATGAVHIVRTPVWAYAFVLLGLPGLLVIQYVISRRLTVRLPAARGVVTRQSFAGLGAIVAFIAAFATAMAVVVDPRPGPVLLLVVLCALTWLGFRGYRSLWVRGKWVDDPTVRLVGLHPSFRAALEGAAAHRHEVEVRMARAGWHPDPGGTPSLRYFDGTAWTPHLTALPQQAS